MLGFGVGVDLVSTIICAQSNFLPVLTQVNFLPCEFIVWPFVAHLAPVLTAALAGSANDAAIKVTTKNKTKFFFMPVRVPSPIGFVSPTPKICLQKGISFLYKNCVHTRI